MDNFIKFKTAQGMAELTMKDYFRTFKEFRRVSSYSICLDTLKQELLTFLTPLSNGSPAKFNRPYRNLNTLFNWLVQQKAMPDIVEEVMAKVGIV
ncbi:MAG TPA: hypothetical protein VHT96_15555 [Clostridia bacterium]|nr:hypothetical protein [Clostridia bacterium]